MAVKKELKKLGADFFKGLRFGLGGPPSRKAKPKGEIKRR